MYAVIKFISCDKKNQKLLDIIERTIERTGEREQERTRGNAGVDNTECRGGWRRTQGQMGQTTENTGMDDRERGANEADNREREGGWGGTHGQTRGQTGTYNWRATLVTPLFSFLSVWTTCLL